MKAILLAAGRGSRMGHMTEQHPKCLVEFAGRPLIEWQLAALRGAGIKQIAAVTGYKKERLKRPDLHLFVNDRWEKTNMVISLRCAREWLERHPCVISYSDIAYDSSAVVSLLSAKSNIAITYDPDWLKLWQIRFDDPLSDAETFRVDSHGNLLDIGNRASDINAIEGQYMGLLRITPEGWAAIEAYLDNLHPEKVDRTDITSLLKGLIKEGEKIETIPISGRWYEIDSPNDLEAYTNLIKGFEQEIFKVVL